MKVPLSGTLKLCKTRCVEFEHRAGRSVLPGAAPCCQHGISPGLELTVGFGGYILQAPRSMLKSALVY